MKRQHVVAGAVWVSMLMLGGCTQDDSEADPFDAGAVSNLQSFAWVSSSKAYVTQYDGPMMLVVDPSSGDITGGVDLGGYVAFRGTDTVETSPFASAVVVHNGKAYVACQRLNKFVNSFGTAFDVGDTSMVVVIDVATDAIVGEVALQYPNPVAMSVAGDELFVVSNGSWQSGMGSGIERISMSTGASLGTVAGQEQLGGQATDIAMVSTQKGFVAVSGHSADWTQFWTSLVPFTFDGSALLVDTAVAWVRDASGGLAVSGGRLYVGDRGAAAPGVVVYDVDSGRVVGGPLDVGMPPSAMAMVGGTLVVTTVAADYSTASMATVQASDLSVSRDLLDIHSDNKVFAGGDDTYVLERMGMDNIMKITGSSVGSSAVVYQVKLGN